MSNLSNYESSTVLPIETGTINSQTQTYVTWLTWVICLVGAIFYCYEYLLRIMPSIMELELRQAFQLDAAAFGNLMGFYYYAYTPMQFPVGILMDNYGPRRLLIFACLICALGSCLFTIENSLLISQIGRLLVGLGSAFAFIGFLKLATLWLPAHRFSFVTGLTMTLCMLSVTQGNLLVSFLMKHHSWRETILIFAGLGLILSIIMVIIIPKKNKPATYNHPPVIGVKTLCKEMLKLMKNPYIWANGIIGCLLFLSLSAFAEAWGVSYFEQGRGYSKEIAVHLNNYVFWGWAIGSPLMGWISDTLKNRRLLLLCGTLGTALTFAALLYTPISTPLWIIKSLLFFVGVCSSVEILVFPIARELSSSTLAASALAFTNLLVMMGGVILQPGIGYLLQLNWSGQTINNIPIYSLEAYQTSLLAIALGALLASAVAFFMRETYKS